MRVGNSTYLVPVLVAVGVDKRGIKRVLGFQSGDKESCSTWREFFKDLKKRGLKSKNIKLGIMDGLVGLEKIFKEEFRESKIQRCQIHVTRNVLVKVPRKYKKQIADEIRNIFYASSKEKAYEFFRNFKNKWKKIIPSAVKTLENNMQHPPTFYSFPEEEWVSIRSTNVIERLK